jgi:RimJ/RimL family protein N-acetyltransferase
MNSGDARSFCDNRAVEAPWPVAHLRVRSNHLELRPPTDEDVAALLSVARSGIHDPRSMPFDVAWTDARGTTFDDGFLAFFHAARTAWSVEAWKLPLAVVLDGLPIGVQEVRANDFPTMKTVETGSWLGLEWQGRGIGTEMRAAVLAFAFDGLGALTARSAALDGNEASRRISMKLGYQPAGSGVVAPRGSPVRQDRFLLAREDFPADRWPITITGLEASRPMFG